MALLAGWLINFFSTGSLNHENHLQGLDLERASGFTISP